MPVFAHRGLRLARNWFVGSAIALLLVVTGRQPGLVLAIIAGSVGLGVASLLIPCLGIHRKLRDVKRSELARVRDAVERRSAALIEGRRTAEEDPDIPALLAYESRIRGVSEWPFDSPMLMRFLLLVLIPLGSWVAGALVERLVDAALE